LARARNVLDGTTTEGTMSDERGLTRRSFLRGSGTGIALLGGGAALTMLGGCPDDSPNTSYTSEQKERMDALADAVVPGYYWAGGAWRYSDPDYSAGAAAAGSWNLYWDTYYGLNGWIDECADDLGSSFKTASLSSRMATLQQKLNGNNGPWYASGAYTPIYRGAVLLAKLAFFGGVVSSVGTSYIGFPGPTTSGYAPLSSNPYP
jgi:hypothetical protein